MNQYFQENRALPRAEREFGVDWRGMRLTFAAQRGLFSCREVDPYSVMLADSIPPISGALLDLGCGYGAVGIMLARANPVALAGCDINGLAVAAAARNAARNGVGARYFVSDCLDGLPPADMFGHIALNPPIHAGKETLGRMFRQSRARLLPGGALYVVAQKKHGARAMLAELSAMFGNCEVLRKKKGAFVAAFLQNGGHGAILDGREQNTAGRQGADGGSGG